MGPSLLKERMTNSSLLEVLEFLIPYDFMVTSLGGNDSNDMPEMPEIYAIDLPNIYPIFL